MVVVIKKKDGNMGIIDIETLGIEINKNEKSLPGTLIITSI